MAATYRVVVAIFGEERREERKRERETGEEREKKISHVRFRVP